MVYFSCGIPLATAQSTRSEVPAFNAFLRIGTDGRIACYTGKIEMVNSELLLMLLNAGYLPVIAPVAVSEKGEALNVDADRAAAMVAAALQAETLLLLTAVPGLMKNFPDESTLIRQLPQSQLPAASEAAQGRMKKKVLGAAEALNGGVSRVIIADGQIQNPITNALAGNGTVIE